MKFKIFKFKSVTSTNDVALNLIQKEKKIIGCVYADMQTKGRGTHGREWISDKGNFFGSIFFPLKNNYPPFNEFSIINPIIISGVIKHFCKKKNIKLKFPNDIFVNRRKICGILQELITINNKKFLIIGIGVNIVSNPDINNKYQATNILLITSDTYSKFIKKNDVSSHPMWRNEECAMSSTRRVVKIAERYKKKIHVLHVTTKEEVEFLSRYKGNVSFEITPQHLTLSAPHCYKLLGSLAQMNPPIREKKHQDMLWKATREGVADIIGSDHAPHSLENKKKEYPQTPSGMPGVQTLVPLMLNHVNNNKLALNQFIKLVCENPVRIFGIKNKGYIKEGYDADLTIVDMNMKKVIKNDWIASKCGWTPFDGYEVKGFPLGTIVNGKAIVWDGKLIEKANGKPLRF